MFKHTLVSLVFVITNLFANSLGLSSNNNGTWDVTYSSQEIIAGFQFNVDGATINGGSGGDAAANGFLISTSGTTAIGFSLSGGSIPPGDGTLLVLDLDGDGVVTEEEIRKAKELLSKVNHNKNENEMLNTMNDFKMSV